MKLPVKVGLLFATIWIAVKMTALAFSFSLDDIKIFVFINMFLLTAAIAYSLYVTKRQERDSNLLNDIKTGMLAGVPYTVLLSGFLYFYYQTIYPEFNEKKKAEIAQRLENPKLIKQIQTSAPGMQNKTKEEIIKQQMQQADSIYNAKFTMVVSLLALMVYSTLNSLMIAIIYRRIVFRN